MQQINSNVKFSGRAVLLMPNMRGTIISEPIMAAMPNAPLVPDFGHHFKPLRETYGSGGYTRDSVGPVYGSFGDGYRGRPDGSIYNSFQSAPTIQQPYALMVMVVLDDGVTIVNADLLRCELITPITNLTTGSSTTAGLTSPEAQDYRRFVIECENRFTAKLQRLVNESGDFWADAGREALACIYSQTLQGGDFEVREEMLNHALKGGVYYFVQATHHVILTDEISVKVQHDLDEMIAGRKQPAPADAATETSTVPSKEIIDQVDREYRNLISITAANSSPYIANNLPKEMLRIIVANTIKGTSDRVAITDADLQQVLSAGIYHWSTPDQLDLSPETLRKVQSLLDDLTNKAIADMHLTDGSSGPITHSQRLMDEEALLTSKLRDMVHRPFADATVLDMVRLILNTTTKKGFALGTTKDQINEYIQRGIYFNIPTDEVILDVNALEALHCKLDELREFYFKTMIQGDASKQKADRAVTLHADQIQSFNSEFGGILQQTFELGTPGSTKDLLKEMVSLILNSTTKGGHSGEVTDEHLDLIEKNGVYGNIPADEIFFDTSVIGVLRLKLSQMRDSVRPHPVNQELVGKVRFIGSEIASLLKEVHNKRGVAELNKAIVEVIHLTTGRIHGDINVTPDFLDQAIKDNNFFFFVSETNYDKLDLDLQNVVAVRDSLIRRIVEDPKAESTKTSEEVDPNDPAVIHDRFVKQANTELLALLKEAVAVCDQDELAKYLQFIVNTTTTMVLPTVEVRHIPAILSQGVYASMTTSSIKLTEETLADLKDRLKKMIAVAKAKA